MDVAVGHTKFSGQCFAGRPTLNFQIKNFRFLVIFIFQKIDGCRFEEWPRKLIRREISDLDPSPIYHWKAHKLLYRHHISDLPDAHLTCLRSVTYRKQTCNLIIISPSPQFHLYPNCNSTQVCKMGRTPFQMFQLLYGQYFFRFFQKFFKIG